jgi:spore maturation protein CgeB
LRGCRSASLEGWRSAALEGRGGWGTDMKPDVKNFSISSREQSSHSSSKALLKQSAPQAKRPSSKALALNTTICRKNHPYLDINLTDIENDRVIPVFSKNGLPTFKYDIGAGKAKYFHSSYDPLSEAVKWAGESSIDGDSIIVVLGVGFFYHISELIKEIPDDRIVILLERDEEIFRAALKAVDLRDVLSRDNLYLFVGREPAGAVKFITGIQINNSFKRITFLPHQPSIQTFPEFYREIIDGFAASGKLNIFDRLRYKKFCREEVRVLLLTTRYFLMGEIISAMKRLNIKYRLITIEQYELGCQEFIEEIIKDILDFKPDFLFTINHLGMDREGMLAQFLARIEMPFASWYVDNPNLIIKRYEKNVTPCCAMFLWDKDNLPDMRDIGFEHTFYMPLGVDERRFRPIKNEVNPMPHLTSDVAFVGNSMVKKVRDTLMKTGVNGGLNALFKDIARDYMESEERRIEEIIRLKYPELYDDFQKLGDVNRTSYETAVNWEATKIYRLERIKRLLPFKPLIVGDPHWPELIDDGLFRYHRELAYYNELPFLYNVATINFNATSRQMKGAVNQRVFDVPACMAFLLTDYQEQMDELFTVGEEVICYQEPDEIAELIKYYMDHERERKQVAQKGYERVIRDHTYVSRVTGIVGAMRKIFS